MAFILYILSTNDRFSVRIHGLRHMKDHTSLQIMFIKKKLTSTINVVKYYIENIRQKSSKKTRSDRNRFNIMKNIQQLKTISVLLKTTNILLMHTKYSQKRNQISESASIFSQTKNRKPVPSIVHYC